MVSITMEPPSTPMGVTPTAQQTPPSVNQDAEEIYTIITHRKSAGKKPILAEVADDEPLIDTTAKLTLRSKKTERLQKRAAKKQQAPTKKTPTTSQPLRNPGDPPPTLTTLPAELLEEILACLRPSDLSSLLLVSRPLHAFITHHAPLLTRRILSARYSVLSRCLYPPLPLSAVPHRATRRALRSPAWQDRLAIHTRPYAQHIPPPDPRAVCSCMACRLAWNNLCLVLDLAEFAPRLARHEPLPVLPRGLPGGPPEWLTRLLARTGDRVRRVVQGGGPQASAPAALAYARILQTHLETMVVLLRREWRRPAGKGHPKGAVVWERAKDPPYGITEADAASGTDAFLERKGPENFEFPFARDVYYSLEAYVPNRKWSKEKQRWLYPTPGQAHVQDLARFESRFGTVGMEERESSESDEAGTG